MRLSSERVFNDWHHFKVTGGVGLWVVMLGAEKGTRFSDLGKTCAANTVGNSSLSQVFNGQGQVSGIIKVRRSVFGIPFFSFSLIFNFGTCPVITRKGMDMTSRACKHLDGIYRSIVSRR